MRLYKFINTDSLYEILLVMGKINVTTYRNLIEKYINSTLISQLIDKLFE
jgi:hypothetical protein